MVGVVGVGLGAEHVTAVPPWCKPRTRGTTTTTTAVASVASVRLPAGPVPSPDAGRALAARREELGVKVGGHGALVGAGVSHAAWR